MRRLVILGAGTAGTMAAHRLRRALHRDRWEIVVVDPSGWHLYQPGLLFLPFGRIRARDLTRTVSSTLPRGVELVQASAERIEPVGQQVLLDDGRRLGYDYLLIATGTTPRPDQTPGMAEGMGRSVHEFFTLNGSLHLAAALAGWTGGRIAVHVAEAPIKCPVAPLEMVFLLDAYLAERGLRGRTELTYVTPLSGAFTRPVASRALGTMLDERGISVETDFVVESIDPEAGTMTSFDDREVPFDLLITVPVNMGADVIGRSGLGDDLNYVPVHRGTLLSSAHDTIFAIGDAADLPTSKAGSVAHFQVETLVANLVEHVEGRPMVHEYDGHANCFIESGRGRGLLIDFNYDTEPLPGTDPLPRLGPLTLLRESRRNHWAKLAFRWVYWHLLLPGRWRPVPSRMSMVGKHRPPEPAPAGTTVPAG